MSFDAAGPEIFCGVPTTIGVGVVTGLIRGLTAGIEFVTITFTGADTGSTEDCEYATVPRVRTKMAENNSFLFISEVFRRFTT